MSTGESEQPARNNGFGQSRKKLKRSFSCPTSAGIPRRPRRLGHPKHCALAFKKRHPDPMNIDGVCLPRGRQGGHELGPNREKAGQRDKAPALACLRMPLPVGMHRIIPRRLLAAVIAGSFGLAGCSAMIADHTPTALGSAAKIWGARYQLRGKRNHWPPRILVLSG